MLLKINFNADLNEKSRKLYINKIIKKFKTIYKNG